MADTKISALPASTTPLAGTEVLPIVQSGSTKQVSVANLTAGRAISALGLTVSGLTASTALALNASKEAVSVTNTGTGNNVLATSPTLVTPVIGAATGTSLVTTSQVTSQKTATTTKIQSVGFQTYFNPGNSTTFTITPSSGLAWAFVISEGSGGGGALVFCSYANTTINIVSASVGARSFVASNTPTASQLGIFKLANDSVISFVSGASWGAGVAICLLGDFIGAVTDPV
jgi:hypothetical protein